MGNLMNRSVLKEDLRTYLRAIDLMKGLTDEDYKSRHPMAYMADQYSLDQHRKSLWIILNNAWLT